MKQSSNWQPLHSATLWLPFLETIQKLFIPGVLFAYMSNIRQAIYGLALILTVVTLFQIARYLSFRYRVTSTEIQIRQGIVWKQERRVVTTRIQDVLIQQGILHQLFKLAKVVIKTAGHEEQEVTLEVTSLTQANHLKEILLDRQRSEEMTQSSPSQTENSLVQLSIVELVLGAVTSKAMATLLALVGTIFYFKIFVAFLGSFLGNIDLPHFDPFAQWGEFLNPWRGTLFGSVIGFFLDETFGKTLLFIFGGFLLSLIRYLVRYGGYHLTESSGVLTKSHGIFRHEKNSLSRTHVHAMKIDESLLRRWFGLADIWVDSGGDQAKIDEEKNRTSFVPVIRRSRAFRLAEEIFVQLDRAEPTWRRVSRKAILRGTRVGWLILLFPTLATSISFGWLSLIFLPTFPLAFFLNLKWYQNRGFWLDQDLLISRNGWFNRETLYLPITHIQNIRVSQNPFDRRLGLATLSIDTAGQSNTGGGPTVRNLPLGEARQIQAHLALAQTLLPKG